MIKLKDILIEIGDAGGQVYGDLKPTESSGGRYKYEFTTESGLDYIVDVAKRSGYGRMINYGDNFILPEEVTEFEMGFTVKGQDSTVETNKGELYKVMATVVNFVRGVVESDPSANDKTQKVIVFVPAKKDPEDSRRLRLYTAYLQKQVTGVEIEGPDKDGKYRAYLPKK